MCKFVKLCFNCGFSNKVDIILVIFLVILGIIYILVKKIIRLNYFSFYMKIFDNLNKGIMMFYLRYKYIK